MIDTLPELKKYQAGCCYDCEGGSYEKIHKKRILAAVLAAVLIMVALPVSLSSDASTPAASIPGIDYSRIHEGMNAASMKAYIKLGNFSIPGKLECGNCVARSDANKIINEVMKEMGITSAFLSKAKTLVDRTAARYALSAEEIVSALSGEVGDYLTMMKALGSSGNIEDVGALVTSALTGAAAAAVGIEGAAAYAVGVLASLGYTELVHAIEAHKNGEEMSDIISAMIAAAKLADFYDEVNDRIKGIDQKKGTTRLVFDGAYVVYSGQSFMGVSGQEIGLKATGTLVSDFEFDIDKYLNKGGFDAQTVFSGTYTGNLTITINYHLENFDAKFKEEVFLNSKLPFTQMNMDSFGTLIDIHTPTKLTKKLTCNNLTVTVDAKKPRYGSWTSVELPLGQFTDESTYHLDHHMMYVPNSAIPYLQEDGTFDYSGAGTTFHQEVSTEFWFEGALRDKRYADLVGVRFKYDNNVSASIPGYSSSFDDSKDETTSVSLVKDNDPFRFLSSPAKVFVDTASYEDHR